MWIQPSWFKLFPCGLNGHKMTNYPKFAKMYEMFQGENALTSNGKVVVDVKKNHYVSECSRCKCRYQKHNHMRIGVPRERIMEEKNYYGLGKRRKVF